MSSEVASETEMNALRPRTWCFDLMLHMQEMSGQGEVREVFCSILRDATDRKKIPGLHRCSFSYGAPEQGCLARISGFLHALGKISYQFVCSWIIDDRIHGDIKWTPVEPGRRVDWTKHEKIIEICDACNGVSRRLEDWAGDSSAPVNRGGRPKKTPAPADEGTENAAAASAPKQRGRPPIPPPVETDTPIQKTMRAMLHRWPAENVNQMCQVMLTDVGSWAGETKNSQVQRLVTMSNHQELASRLFIAPRATETAADPQPEPAVDMPELADLRATLNSISMWKVKRLCECVFPPPEDLVVRGLSKRERITTLLSRPVEVARALAATEPEAPPAPTPPPPPPPLPPPPPPDEVAAAAAPACAGTMPPPAPRQPLAAAARASGAPCIDQVQTPEQPRHADCIGSCWLPYPRPHLELLSLLHINRVHSLERCLAR